MKIDRATEAALTRLEKSAPSWAEVPARCLDLIERAVPFDSATWFALDPPTLLPTRFEQRTLDPLLQELNQSVTAMMGRSPRETELKLLERLMKLELSVEDSFSPAALVRAPGSVATLHGITGGRPDRSPRYEFYPVPGIVEDELRLVLKDAGEGWAMMSLIRRETPFTRTELDTAAAVGPRLAALVRLSLLREALDEDGMTDPPGLILMKDDVSIASVSPEAERLLGTWSAEAPWHWLSVLRATRRPGHSASMVVEGIGGPVTAHATSFGAQEAVIVERVRPYRLADRLVRAYGLTPRERDVAGGLSRGWSTRQIAFELDLADYTVQDHLRSIFDKVGVRSRKEVLAKLFFDRYLPEHAADRRPSPYGWFLGDRP
ncbi:MAG: helix-turn-helix transcriptional regulator [Deltaproteobacteria bacterium]|nr:helix-turn-helix transcriptional regulator [Deltaproteobacteria bacterium]